MAPYSEPDGDPPRRLCQIVPFSPGICIFGPPSLNPEHACGQASSVAGPGLRRAGGALLRHRPREVFEELIGHLLGGAIDEALPQLRELAADLRIDMVGKLRAAAVVCRQRYRGAARGGARHPAAALAGDAIAVRRIEIGQPDLAFELGLDRPDF